MSSSNLIRWSGLSALVGGGLLAAFDILDAVLFLGKQDSEIMGTGLWLIVQLMGLAALVFFILGLVGLYARQAEQAGSFGVVSFLVAFVGTMMLFAMLWGEPFLGPTLVKEAPEILDVEPSGSMTVWVIITLILFALGYTLFGLASLQTHVLPRGASVLLIIGAVLAFVLQLLDLPFSVFVLGAAMAWMGYSLWSAAGEPVMAAEAALRP